MWLYLCLGLVRIQATYLKLAFSKVFFYFLVNIWQGGGWLEQKSTLKVVQIENERWFL